MKKLPFTLISLLILLVSLAACGGDEEPMAVEETAVSPTITTEPTAEPDPTESPTAEPTIAPTLEPTAEPTIEPTVEPTAEPTAEPIAEPSGLTIDQISLDSSPLGVDSYTTLIPASSYDASQPPGPKGLPEHVVVTFDNDDPASREFGDPILYIIPVDAYKALWEEAGNDSVSRMMDNIAEMATAMPSPAPTSGMPVLPFEETTGFNDIAVQVEQPASNADSASQEGYRFVGRFMQSPNPVTNWRLRYIYQGFSTDGEYLISFFYPIRTDALPDEADAAMMDAFEADTTGHIDDSIAMLNALETGDWEPDIAAFDAVIASLQIEGMDAVADEASSLPAELIDETWQWINFTDPISGTQAIPEPERYQLMLNADGSYNVQADCNSGGGTYTVDGSSISFGPAALTRAACPPDSLADDFMRNLEAAAIYFMQDGDLFLDLLYDSGTMQLTAVSETAVSEPPPTEPESADEATNSDQITAESIQMDTQGLASSWTWQVVNGTPAASSYILLTFDDADLETTLTKGLPHIAIFPVESYIAAGGERVENEVLRLQELIDGATPADPMPLLPPPSSFMGRWAQFAPLDFGEGSGVRYVSEAINRQDIGPWVNDGTAYYYQGLTENGRFYISLVWPVRTDSLPDTYEDVPEETVAIATDSESYEQYLIDTQNMLNLLPSSAWEPNLADLDALVQSLNLYE